MRQSAGGRVKRRPLPSNPNGSHITPDTIPEAAAPGRARHGPRDFSAPPRSRTLPEGSYQHHQLHSLYGHQPLPHTMEPSQNYDDPQGYSEQSPYDDAYGQPDFLPQLPPSNRQRSAVHHRLASQQARPSSVRPQQLLQGGLPHSHSAPIVPQAVAETDTYNDGMHLRTEYPEPIPDVDYQHRQLRQRRMDVPPGWQEEYGDPYGSQQLPAELEAGPPPPPMHSSSAPMVPHFATPPDPRRGSTPPNARHHSVPNVSPLQGGEQGYGSPREAPMRGHHPPRGRSVDDYASSPGGHPYDVTPSSSVPGQQAPSPYGRSPAARAMPHSHSVTNPYGHTPPRPAHPLSQEVARARSPLPAASQPAFEQAQYQRGFRNDGPPFKAHTVSPQPPAASRSMYNLQYPIRAFASSDQSPLSTSRSDPRLSGVAGQGSTSRKSVSPRPSPVDGGSPGGMPFSPDSFDVHNPTARSSPLGASPRAPWHVRPGSSDERGSEQKGPIVGWHGQEIDPSDHLPVDSWAPEPEKKTPTKTYGLGRDRDFGPRSAGGTPTGSPTAANGRLGKDTLVNFRMKTASEAGDAPPPPSSSSAAPGGLRNRLHKRSWNGGGSRSPILPLQEHENFNGVPDPYAQQQEYSRGFMSGSPGYGPPHVPPKLPLQSQQQQQQQQHDYGQDALTREISSIDIGSSSRHGGRPLPPAAQRGVPAPLAYVPVRSHRDRGTYY